MHEVSIIEGLIDIVEKQREQHGFSRVGEVRIACGIYNCVSEENLRFCLQTVGKGTCLEDARITVHRLPERWSCVSCEADFVRGECLENLVCPRCASSNVLSRLNNEIYLDSLEVI